MPEDDYEMEARTHDSALRWIVNSRKRPDIDHMVDLAVFGGIGSCSCEHFQFRLLPKIRDGQRIGANRCSHILVARRAFTDAMIQILVRQKQRAAAAAAEKEQQKGTNWL